MSADVPVGKFFFPRPPSQLVKIEAKRVLCIPFPRDLFLGDAFATYRKTSDAKRAISFLLYLLEVVISSQTIACFEVVRDDSYTKVGMDRVVFIRLWIFLENDERADAFNAHAERLVTPNADDDNNDTVAKKKNRKRSYGAAIEPPEMSHTKISTRTELIKCLVQFKLSHVSEKFTVEFTHAGSFVDLDGSAEDSGQGMDEETSLVARLDAEGYFSHPLTEQVLEEGRVHADDAAFSAYAEWDAAEDRYVWTVSDARKLSNIRLLDARLGSTQRWLSGGDMLLSFRLPHCEPTAYELRTWLHSQASVVGIKADDIDDMTLADLHHKIDTMMLSPVMYAPIVCLRSKVGTGACSWSDCRNAEIHPENEKWRSDHILDQNRMHKLVADGDMTPADMKRHTISTLSDLRILTSEPIQGWPDAYPVVRETCSRDMNEYNDMVESGDSFTQTTLRQCMFPSTGRGFPANMSATTFWLFQFVEMMRCEFGLDRPQAHMCTVIYPWAFVLLVPLFGMPGSLQARGPPGAGKGEGKKRLQNCVNSRMWFSCDSFSEQSTTFEGLPAMCFWDMDENQNQGKKEGTTLTAQTTDSNGLSKRARGNVEAGITIAKAIDVRHVNLGSSNVALPGPLSDRAVFVELPRSQGEFRTDMTRGAPLISLCFRIMTGLSAWVWLFYMANLFSFEETALHVFYGINKVLDPDSKYAVHARTKEGVRILSMAITVMELVSMYYRRTERRLKEDSSYSFLSFVRANAMISPTAVWSAFLLITTGEDPRRSEKTLAMFKANLRQVSGGTYLKTADDLYYQTKFVKPGGDAECSELVRAADDAGLGMAICTQTISDLLTQKCPESGHPILKMEQEGTTARTRYCVLMTAVSNSRVLTPAEHTILSLLSDEIDKGENVFISEDETQYVFKESIRQSIVAPLPMHRMSKHGKMDIMAATDMISQMNLGFDISAGLVVPISIVHATRLPNSRRATPGGPLDPNCQPGGVYVGSLPRGNVVVLDRDAFDAWRVERDGPTAAETQKRSKQAKLGSFFFSVVGAPDGEVVFGGVGGADDTCAVHKVDYSASETQSVKIDNPYYVQRAGRFTQSVQDTTNHCGLFPPDARHVEVTASMHLCRTINAFNAARYQDTDGLAYNYP
ncbi:MAG: hypothetical protein CMO80_14195 [Verrucomicrobiales bacterium]|nr:hypothetical protein [Verrucomicrobiales bacterium]